MNNYLNAAPAEVMTAMQQNHSAAQDQMARQRGFRNYQQMLDWAARRSEPVGGTTANGGPPTARQAINDASAWHPKVIFERISRAFEDALK